MTRTPDEIKKGLECCIGDDEDVCCDECAYCDEINCVRKLTDDTLTLVQRLEERNTWHEGNEKYLQSFMNDMSRQIEQLQAERDAAVADLADHCGSKTLCKKYDDGTCPHEFDCTLYLSTCPDFEWRGVQKEGEL
jgi:hypothetical protein